MVSAMFSDFAASGKFLLWEVVAHILALSYRVDKFRHAYRPIGAKHYPICLRSLQALGPHRAYLRPRYCLKHGNVAIPLYGGLGDPVNTRP